jgi:23S rRNA (cytosine1962-C5)-methyltransferase
MTPSDASPDPETPASNTESRLRLRLTPAAEAAVRERHPWLYAGGIREENRLGYLGELAVLYDRRNRFLGIGLFDPDSPIRVRVLYVGPPRPLDEAWWRKHLAEAVARRQGLFASDTTGYRYINGESDGWPGLVLDRYDTTLVLKLYSAAWAPRLAELVTLIQEQIPHERIVLRLSRNLQSGATDEGSVLSGSELVRTVTFQEHGLRFEADVLRGQKTGFFLDQRENRAFVETLASGREVLNAFSFSGGFSLYAARGGAKSVTDVDISRHALESAERNFALNRANATLRACHHEGVQADVFDWLRDSPPRQFDLIVLDPPSLARKDAQRAEALKAYGRLARLGVERMRRGGILVAASCSAHVPAQEFFTVVRRTARNAGRVFRELRTTFHPLDHPATFPEAQYLKCIYLRFE